MSFLDILRTAFFALRGNWMRSALTSLGVIIGIAAVIVMVSIGQGTQAEIDKMVAGLGSQRLDIGGAGGMGPGGARIAQGSRWSLNDGDAEAIRDEIPSVQYVSGSLRGSSQVWPSRRRNTLTVASPSSMAATISPFSASRC